MSLGVRFECFVVVSQKVLPVFGKNVIDEFEFFGVFVHINFLDRGKCDSLCFGHSQLEVRVNILPLLLGLLEPIEGFSFPGHDIFLGRVQSGQKGFMVFAVHVNSLFNFALRLFVE